MGIKVIEKDEEGTRSITPVVEPCEKPAIDRFGIPSDQDIGLGLQVIFAGLKQCRIESQPQENQEEDRLANLPNKNGCLKNVVFIEHIIFVVSKAAIQAGVVRAMNGIGYEARGRIAAGRQILGQHGDVLRRGVCHLMSSSWGQRPLKKLACDMRVQGAAACAASKRIPRLARRSSVGVVER